MEYVNFYERIQNIKDLKLISEKICEHYDLGALQDYKHVEVGYEDFNLVITTESGKYFVKILNKSRPREERLRLIKILEKSISNQVKIPKILQKNQKSIFELEIEKKRLHIIVMDYIEGTNMLFLNRDFNELELTAIAKEMAKINQINYGVEAYYDEWTITNFTREYEKKIAAIDEENKEQIIRVYNKMKTLDFSEFPKCYIHGDIIKSNLILDINNHVWVIDFSVLNYLPRIIELAVAMFGLCLTNIPSKSIKNMNILINEYNKRNTLEEFEIKNLPLIFQAVCAMNVLQTAYIKNTDKTFEENEHWLSEGKKGLALNLKQEDLKITRN